MLENVLWRLRGVMPSDWVTRNGGSTLLSAEQVEKLAAKVQSRLGITIDKLPGMNRKTWWPISRQVHADVSKNGKVDRILADLNPGEQARE
jgi:hypothetical protein